MALGLRHLVFLIAAWLSTATGCGEATAPTIPPAELYRVPSNFAGDWIGEVGTVMGALEVRRIGHAKYYGSYSADDASIRYVLRLEQAVLAAEEGGDEVGANRVVFTWQDGRGGRGRGWLLINEEDTALTGESFFGDEGGSGLAWQFIRIE
jgi:hypothetical protein